MTMPYRIDSETRCGRRWPFQRPSAPSIQKTAERRGERFHVFLVVKNDTGTALEKAAVTEYLPDDAAEVRVVTGIPAQHDVKEALFFPLGQIAPGEKRVLHYEMAFRNIKLPGAVLEWDSGNAQP